MDDSNHSASRFFVEEISGPLSYLQGDEEALNQQPSVSVPDSIPGQPGDDAVFAPSSTAPQLRHRPAHLPFRMDRVQSAPTLLEHEIGLVLRNISDDFNNVYIQPQINQRRRASHPNMNNNHTPGLLNLWQRISRSSLADSVPSSAGGSRRRESVDPSQRVSFSSVPEENEEASERDLN